MGHQFNQVAPMGQSIEVEQGVEFFIVNGVIDFADRTFMCITNFD